MLYIYIYILLSIYIHIYICIYHHETTQDQWDLQCSELVKCPTHLQAAPRHLQLHVHGGHVFPCLIQIFPCQIRRGLRPRPSEWLRIHPYFTIFFWWDWYLHVEADCIPSVSDYPNIHQSSSKLAPFGCLHQLHPKTTVKICFQHIPQTSKNWSTQPSTNAGKVFWWYPHCFQESTTIFTNHSPTALQLPMAKNNVRYH